MHAKRNPQGIRARHARSCSYSEGGRCTCKPSFEAFVYLPVEGRKLRKSFRTEREAKQWRASAMHALGRGLLKRPLRRTLREEVEDWLARAERGEVLARSQRPYKPSVLRTYRNDLEKYALRDLGGRRVSDVTRRDVQAVVDRLRADGHSSSKVRNVVVALKAVYRRVLENDEMAVNPTALLRLPPAAGCRERTVTADEATRLLNALPVSERAMWATALYAGLRRGELRALRWNDVNLATGVIHVQHSWDDVEGQIDPKSAKGIRDVPVAPILRDYLDAHRAETGRGDSDFVFGSTATTPFTPTNVRRKALAAWAAVNATEREKAKHEGRDAVLLHPIGLHEARHSFVSLMHDAGFSLEQIGDFVGHSSTFMTDRYRHLMPGAAVAASEKFGAYLERANTLRRLEVLERVTHGGSR